MDRRPRGSLLLARLALLLLSLGGLMLSPLVLVPTQAGDQRPLPTKKPLPPSRTAPPGHTIDTGGEILRTDTGEEVEIHWHEKTRVPRQIRGRKLQHTTAGANSQDARDQQTAREFLRKQRDLLRLQDPDHELKFERSQQDQRGRRSLHFSQLYKGIPVWPADLIVELDDEGDADLLTGGHLPTPGNVIITPVVNAKMATTLARRGVPGGDIAQTSVPVLIIYAPADRIPRLGWKLEVAVSPASRWLVIIDALAGVTLTAQNQVRHANVQVSAPDLQNVSRNLNVWADQFGTRYLVDTSKPMFDPASTPPARATTKGGLVILDAQNQGPVGNFSLTQLNFPGIPNLSVRHTEGVSAVFGLSETYDYFLERHGRNSLDGQGGTITAVVGVGQNFDGAYWNGFGAYFGNAYDYVAALDIVAHELTHGVIENTSGFVYTGQSAALTEAFADIFGEMVEARTKNGAPDWKKVVTKTGLQPRTLQDYITPGAVQCTTNHTCPSKMSEYVTDPGLGGGDPESVLAHTNSSIIAHAFYLLAEGLPGAIGRQSAEQIFYCTLTTKLIAQAQFTDVRLGAVACARQLFGQPSPEESRTIEAFDSVEIVDAPPTVPIPPTAPVNGPDNTLFVYNSIPLERRESGLGDPAIGSTIFSGFSPLFFSPSVTGDGSTAAFVHGGSICLAKTDVTGPQNPAAVCSGIVGAAVSAAISRDGQRIAIPSSQFLNHIFLLNQFGAQLQEFVVQAPAAEGGSSITIQQIGSLAFSADGHELIFEALSFIQFEGNFPAALWSIYTLDIATGRVTVLVPPTPGIDHRYPALSHITDQFVTFENQSPALSTANIMVLNRQTGDLSAIVSNVQESFFATSQPVYTGDDTAIVYTVPPPAPQNGCRRQPLSGYTTPTGPSEDWVPNASSCVIYRRGAYTSQEVPTLTVQRAGTGGGFVTASPPGILCGTDCSEPYRTGTTVTLIATADATSHFAGWTGPLDCADGVVTITAATTCTATFSPGAEPKTTTITVTLAGSGRLRIISQPSGLDCGTICTAAFPLGTTVTLTVLSPTDLAFTNPSFLGWSGDPDCTDGQVTLTAARNCVATFGFPAGTQLATVTVSISQGSGTVTSFPYGIVCTSPAPVSGNLCQGTFPQTSPIYLQSTAAPGFIAGTCSPATPCVLNLLNNTQVMQAVSFSASPGALPGDDVSRPIIITSDPFLDRRVTSTYGTFGTFLPFSGCINNNQIVNRVFYRVTPTISGTALVSTIGSSYDTVVDVFRADTTLIPLACNDNTPEDPTIGTSKLDFVDLSAGSTYLIRVSSKVAPASSLLNFSFRLKPGDASTSPIVIGQTPFSDTRSTVDYLPNAHLQTPGGPPEPTDTCATALGNTVYYRFTPTDSGTAIITTKGSDYDTVLSIRQEVSGQELPKGCNDDAGTTAPFDVTSKVVVRLKAGVAYLIKASSLGGLGPDFGLGGTLTFTLSYFPIPGGQVPLTVTRAGAGTGTVTGTGINCGADCTESFTDGAFVQLTATANPGSTFTGWQGGGCSGNSLCSVLMDSPQKVTATFAPGSPTSYTLTVINKTGGMISSPPCSQPICMQSETAGSAVTVSAFAPLGLVVNYNGCDTLMGGIGGCQVTMTGNRSVTVEVLPSFLVVRVRPGTPGRVTSSPAGVDCVTGVCIVAVPTGQAITLNAQPTNPSHLVDWFGCFNAVGSSCPLNSPLNNMSGKQSVSVGFRQNLVPVIITKRPEVSGFVVQSDPSGITCGSTCAATFPAGTTVQFTPSNAVFEDHGIECLAVGFLGQIVCGLHLDLVGFGTPQGFIPGHGGFQQVAATVALAPHVLEIRRTGTGSGSVTSDPAGVDCRELFCSAQFNDGNLFTLVATPAPGSVFGGWTGCDAVSGDQNRNCAVPLTSGRSVTSSFNSSLHILTVKKPLGPGLVTSEPAGLSCAAPSCVQNLTSGATLRLKAQGINGSSFLGWSGCDALSDDDCLVDMSSPRTVTSTFTHIAPVRPARPARTPPPTRQ